MLPRALLEALSDLVVITSTDGRIVDAGIAARAFLGERLTRARHLADLLDVVEPSIRLRTPDVAIRALRRNGHWQGAIGLLDNTGTVVPFQVTVRTDRTGAVVLVAHDISADAARRAVEIESRSKDELIARLGHELRTPLNAMLGFAQLLELEPLPAELQDDVLRIITGGRHMQALINDVLDLARLRAGRGDISKGPVNVLDIARGVVDLVEPLAERRGIRRVIHPAEPLIADADRRRLWQVLLNLVGNAVKYGREGGCIRVGIVPVTGARVRIEVEDDGAGMSAHAMTRLFRPFERLGAENTGVEGSGLGLALSHALVTAMGGVLTAASRLGVGSVFAVVLDAVDMRFGAGDLGTGGIAAGGVGNVGSGHVGSRDVRGMGSIDAGDVGTGPPVRLAGSVDSPGTLRVVHVSGDPAVRTMVTQALRSQLGADTVSVPRAALAVDAIRRARPALVLVDQDLPDATAPDLLRRLAEDPLADRIPAVVLSTSDDPRERQLMRQAGAAEVLTSPLDVGMIIAVARQLA